MSGFATNPDYDVKTIMKRVSESIHSLELNLMFKQMMIDVADRGLLVYNEHRLDKLKVITSIRSRISRNRYMIYNTDIILGLIISLINDSIIELISHKEHKRFISSYGVNESSKDSPLYALKHFEKELLYKDDITDEENGSPDTIVAILNNLLYNHLAKAVIDVDSSIDIDTKSIRRLDILYLCVIIYSVIESTDGKNYFSFYRYDVGVHVLKTLKTKMLINKLLLDQTDMSLVILNEVIDAFDKMPCYSNLILKDLTIYRLMLLDYYTAVSMSNDSLLDAINIHRDVRHMNYQEPYKDAYVRALNTIKRKG